MRQRMNRKPLHTLAMRTLRGYVCSWCEQRLDRMKRSKGNCSAFDPEARERCGWNARLNLTTAQSRTQRGSA